MSRNQNILVTSTRANRETTGEIGSVPVCAIYYLAVRTGIVITSIADKVTSTGITSSGSMYVSAVGRRGVSVTVVKVVKGLDWS